MFSVRLIPALLILATTAFAQRTTANLYDSWLANTILKLTNEQTGSTHKSTSNERVEFTLSFLPPGNDALEVNTSKAVYSAHTAHPSGGNMNLIARGGPVIQSRLVFGVYEGYRRSSFFNLFGQVHNPTEDCVLNAGRETIAAAAASSIPSPNTTHIPRPQAIIQIQTTPSVDPTQAEFHLDQSQ